MKQLIFLFLGVAVFITAVGIYSKNPFPKNTPLATSTPAPKEVLIGNVRVSVEVVDTEAERKKGLGGRETLVKDSGMLFVFPESSAKIAFWMKDMRFPLDIIWINDSKIVKIDKNVAPEPNVADKNLRLYYPGVEIKYVLEVAAGFSDKNNIKVGSDVQLPPII